MNSYNSHVLDIVCENNQPLDHFCSQVDTVRYWLDTMDTHSQPGDDPFMGHHRRPRSTNRPYFEVIRYLTQYWWTDVDTDGMTYGFREGPFDTPREAYRHALHH